MNFLKEDEEDELIDSDPVIEDPGDDDESSDDYYDPFPDLTRQIEELELEQAELNENKPFFETLGSTLKKSIVPKYRTSLSTPNNNNDEPNNTNVGKNDKIKSNDRKLLGRIQFKGEINNQSIDENLKPTPILFTDFIKPNNNNQIKIESIKGRPPLKYDGVKKEINNRVKESRKQDFEKLKQKNQDSQVESRTLKFLKSDFQNKITVPVEKVLTEMTEAVSLGKPLAEDYFKTTIKPIGQQIDKEVQAQLRKQDDELQLFKKTGDDKHKFKAQYHFNKALKAKSAQQVLWQGYASYSQFEKECGELSTEVVWHQFQNSSEANFFEAVSTNSEKFVEESVEVVKFLKLCDPEVPISIAKCVLKPNRKLDPTFVCKLVQSSTKYRGEIVDLLVKCGDPDLLETVAKTLIKEEVSKQSASTLFRLGSPATATSSALNQHFGKGKEYYEEFLNDGKELNGITLLEQPEARAEQLIKLVGHVLKKLLSKAPPEDIKQICRLYYESVYEKFGDLKMAETAVAGHWVLRIVSAALSQERGTGKEVSRILQAIANKTSNKLEPEYRKFCLQKQLEIENFIYQHILPPKEGFDYFAKAWSCVKDDNPASFSYAVCVAARCNLIDLELALSFADAFALCAHKVGALVQQAEYFHSDCKLLKTKKKEKGKSAEVKDLKIRIPGYVGKYDELAEQFRSSYQILIKIAPEIQEALGRVNCRPPVNIKNLLWTYIDVKLNKLKEILPKGWKPVSK